VVISGSILTEIRVVACDRLRAAGWSNVRILANTLLAAVTLLGVLGSGCRRTSGPSWPQDGSLTVGIETAPLHFDPRVGSDVASGRLAEVLLDGLVEKDTAANFVPALALRWEVLDEGLRWRFHLRPGVRFHDGRPFSAADVAWTFNTILDGRVATTKRGALTALASVVEAGPLVVDFRLHQPFGSLLAELGSGLAIVPQGMTPEEMNRHPIGTGAFRFLERTADTVTLVPFADAWQGVPRLTRLVLKEVPEATVRALELRKGSVQMLINDLPPDTLPAFREDPAYRVVESPSASFAYLGFKMDDPVLRDLRVRRAIALAIDRPLLVRTLWRGLGMVTETIFPPGLWARHDGLPPIPYDPPAAIALLEEAGYPDPDGSGPLPRLRLTYKCSTNETYLLQAQVVQSMLAKVGIAIEVRSHEFATFYEDIRKGNFQIFSLVRTNAVDPNLYRLILHSSNFPPTGQNRGRYHNAEFDLLIDQAGQLADPAQRRPLYLRAQEIVAQELPYFILFGKANAAVMAAGVADYRNYPSGEFTALREVTWR
jgi:peptide/nickel transport system substrate-binding protein